MSPTVTQFLKLLEAMDLDGDHAMRLIARAANAQPENVEPPEGLAETDAAEEGPDTNASGLDGEQSDDPDEAEAEDIHSKTP